MSTMSKAKTTKEKVTSSAAAAADEPDANAVPLSTWLSDAKNNNFERSNKNSAIRRTTVAYGIVELLKCSKSKKLDSDEIRIDNFVVSVLKKPSRSWDDVKGVGMISSGMSLVIEEPSFLRDLLEDDADSSDRIVGRCLEVEVTSTRQPQENLVVPAKANGALINNGGRNDDLTGIDVLAAVAEESNYCHLFARVLYELFACEPFPNDALAAGSGSLQEPRQKRAKFQHVEGGFDKAELPFQIPCIVRMQDLGIPASICLMTQNLLECAVRVDGHQPDDAYESLGVVSEDLHLLLLDPNRFLFDNQNQDTDDVQLHYRKDKLYGRDKEEALISDAFCRVSRGQSEAFFIGGFSGSGKSMLVDSLRDKVKAIGGYVIKHKFDPMPREKPLSGVISAFNQLCLMIKGRARPAIAQKLRNEFGVDFSLLMKLLPNVRVLCPEFVGAAVADVGDAMNARSVCFMLLRFVRLISSPQRPVMLFLDDMQWADNTALDVIHTILSDRMGTCMFFVGTYRDNEVQVGHYIFDLIERLEISNVRATKLGLAGLNREDLNTMISDALCLYPRICKSLTDIVFQKTKGNPFFMLEFVQSLKTRGLLRYNLHQKHWVWDEDVIRGEDIADNVLHLLSSKMNGLPDNVQTLLTVMACFGSSTNESVIGYLSESAQYTDIRDGLADALSDGFIKDDGEGHLQFVHDKIREASYDLIPDSDKKQFHFQLGKVLQHSCDGKDLGDTIFLIANQINHGKEWILSDEKYSIAVAELNMKAGKKAVDRCDHKTAYSYFEAAISLLPKEHWESHYDLSLSLNFLASSAANSTCQYDVAEQFLRRTLGMARCLDDQLPSYLLLTQILQAQGKVNDVYTTCSTILTELGETIPESYTFTMASKQMTATLNAYEKVGENWIKGEKTVDKTLYKTLQFYNVIALASYFCKSYSLVIYFTCKAVQLSLQRGLCEHTALALIQFTSVVTKEDNAALCYRIAKNAMSLQERFDVAALVPELYFNFYGRIAWRFESFQAGIGNLRQGFEAGLSCGHADMGLHCAIQVIKNTIYSGANLNSIMKEIDYYLHILETYKSEVTRNFLLIFRETVSTLIDNGQTTSIDATPCVGDLDDQKNKLRDSVLHHSAIRCFWLGHSERCWYYSEKCKRCMNPFDQGGHITAYIAKFFFGLNALDISRKNKHVNRTNEVIRIAIATMKSAAANSDWNFTNKLRLLEAEKQSLQEQHWRAIDLYDASIASAKRSGFIHEQGLACEKAGQYFKRLSNKEKALEYFQQARECYEEWGSSMKVAFIHKELDSISMMYQ